MTSRNLPSGVNDLNEWYNSIWRHDVGDNYLTFQSLDDWNLQSTSVRYNHPVSYCEEGFQGTDEPDGGGFVDMTVDIPETALIVSLGLLFVRL